MSRRTKRRRAWTAGTAASRGQPPRAKAKIDARREAARGARDELLQVLPGIARWALNNTFRLRGVTAAVWTKFPIASENPVTKSMKEEANAVTAECKREQDQAKAAAEGDMECDVVGGAADPDLEIPAQLHIACAMMEALAAAQEGEGAEDRRASLNTFRTELEAMPAAHAAEAFPDCRVFRAFNSAELKLSHSHSLTLSLSFCIRDAEKANTVHDAEKASTGAKRKLWRAPPGAQERIVSHAFSRAETS
ncbi:hypothetical protein N9L19_01340 [bacterium]|nr:hypothetical protein [bacterium]